MKPKSKNHPTMIRAAREEEFRRKLDELLPQGMTYKADSRDIGFWMEHKEKPEDIIKRIAVAI